MEPAMWGSATINPKSALFRLMDVLKGNNIKIIDAVKVALNIDVNFKRITENPRTATARNKTNW